MSNEARERHSGGPSDYSSTSRAVEQDTMLTRTCLVCYQSKPLTGFPTVSQVPSHNHDNEVCNECYAFHLDGEIDNKMWNIISCSQCPTILSREVINILASPMTWERYQYLSERAAQANNSDYRYCFSTTCNSGQTHDGGLVFSCQSCGHQHCTACDVNWHEGETCEQSKARRQAQKQEEAASAEFIQSSTNACPQCHVKIERVDGCDHMTCSCSHQFCWLCLADYAPVALHGAHHHRANCPNHQTEHSPEQIEFNEFVQGRFQEMELAEGQAEFWRLWFRAYPDQAPDVQPE